MTTRVLFFGVGLLVGGVCAAPARSQSYTIQPKRSQATFHAHTNTEEFSGHTDQVEGTVVLAPPATAVKEKVEARVVVDLASLDTSLAMRNRHMRDRYLETKRYPKAVFVLHRVLQPASRELPPDQPTAVRVEGTLAIHGVERPLTAEATVTHLTREVIGGQSFPVEALRVQTSFPVRLGDFHIRTPRFLFIRMSQTIKLDVTLYAEAPRPRTQRRAP